MPFDSESAVLVAPDAPVAQATGKFSPDTAEPVADTHEAVDQNFKAQWENTHSWVDRLALYGKYFSHPLARYEQGIEQSFDRPAVLAEIPKIETTKDTNIVGQAAAPVANAATGLIDALQTAGGASLAANPVALALATPYFAAKTWEAGKKAFHDFSAAIEGKDVSTGTLATDVVNTAMNTLATVGGGRHAAKGIGEMVHDLKPVEEPARAPAAAPKFDAETAKPVEPAVEEAKPVATPFDAETAKPVEVAFDASTAERVPPTQTTLDLTDPASAEAADYGIAARVSESRSAQGNIAPIEPGEGISAEDAVKHGRELLSEGEDPVEALAQFNDTKQISADSVALVRARGEQLAKAAYEALDKYGENSPEYKAAAEADSNWVRDIKPMQTEWHKIGQAQQGETEIDTGNFHGLRRAFVEATGRDFTPDQATEAKEIVGKVKQATSDAEAAKQKVMEEISKGPTKAPPGRSRIVKALSDRADAARERIKARLASGRVSAGLDPIELKDYAEIAAYHLARGVEAGVELVKEFGEKIRPHLEEILAKAKETVADESKPPAWDSSIDGIWQRAKAYIDGGETDFDEVRHKIASDLGIPVEEVTQKLTEPKSTRQVTNQMYAKLAARREMVSNAKQWLQNQQTPGWLRFTRAVPRAFFAAKVFGHGTVGMITHAGLNIFHPEAWSTYWPNFFRQFKLLGMHDQGAYHEMMMENLRRDPNFITARRAGLAVDPTKYVDDYQNTRIGGFLRKVGLTGNRGFDALKLFRMARFNQIWGAMPDEIKTPDNAKLVADSVNHATGVVRMRFGEWANWTFFAPKLEGSRWAWMIADPLRAAKTLSSWDKATPAEQQFAIREVKQKAYITGVYLSLLAVNQGLLNLTHSGQKVNFTDPRKSDFLSFKVGGYNFGVVGPMIGVVRLFANLLHASMGQRDKFEKMASRSDEMAGIGKDYVRGKLSPFAAVATDVATQSDFQKRPMPFSNDKVPSFLRKQGIGKYTYAEYAAINLTPIPVSEAVREVWKKQGMDESDIAHWMKALTSAVVMGGTGARMSPDYRAKK